MKVIRIPQSQADVRSILSEGMDQGSATDYFRGVVDEIVQEIAVMAQLKSHPAIVSYEDHQILPHEGSTAGISSSRWELSYFPDRLPAKAPPAEGRYPGPRHAAQQCAGLLRNTAPDPS